MNISDLFIIYLAFGSPVAMYSLVRESKPFRITRLFFAAACLLFWPFATARWINKNREALKPASLFVTRNGSDVSIMAEAEILRDRIVSIFRSHAGGPNFRSIGMLLERYSALSLALTTKDADRNRGNELFELAAHPYPKIANLCANRRNRSRILRHLTSARSELIVAVGSIGTGKLFSNEAVNLLTKLAKLFDDQMLIRGIEGAFQADPVRAEGIEVRGLSSWNPDPSRSLTEPTTRSMSAKST